MDDQYIDDDGDSDGDDFYCYKLAVQNIKLYSQNSCDPEKNKNTFIRTINVINIINGNSIHYARITRMTKVVTRDDNILRRQCEIC